MKTDVTFTYLNTLPQKITYKYSEKNVSRFRQTFAQRNSCQFVTNASNRCKVGDIPLFSTLWMFSYPDIKLGGVVCVWYQAECRRKCRAIKCKAGENMLPRNVFNRRRSYKLTNSAIQTNIYCLCRIFRNRTTAGTLLLLSL